MSVCGLEIELTGTSDMWDGYVEAAREVFGPSVTLTIDRFHVMKNLQDWLTAVLKFIQPGVRFHATCRKTRLANSKGAAGCG